MTRWLKFNAVGLSGVVVQLAALQLLVRLGMPYLPATALAVEAAVLQNYFWHTKFTWKDRMRGSLWRFHLANGLLSLLGNLAFMKLFTGWLGWPVMTANLTAIAIMSFFNFFAGDRWVFAQRSAVRAASSVD